MANYFPLILYSHLKCMIVAVPSHLYQYVIDLLEFYCSDKQKNGISI